MQNVKLNDNENKIKSIIHSNIVYMNETFMMKYERIISECLDDDDIMARYIGVDKDEFKHLTPVERYKFILIHFLFF